MSLTAEKFIEALAVFASEKDIERSEKIFQGNDDTTKALGVRPGNIFQVARTFINLPLSEIEILLESDYYEVRMGAVSIMDFKARSKKLPDTERKALFDLYLSRHHRLNNWDFVDRAAPSVIGTYLLDKPRDILYRLARSSDVWQRRTAIVSTYAFIKAGQVSDTFNIAELLVNDEYESINKAVGSWIREAGKRDENRLIQFLDKHAATMPRVTLRYAIEKLDNSKRRHYMKLKPTGEHLSDKE